MSPMQPATLEPAAYDPLDVMRRAKAGGHPISLDEAQRVVTRARHARVFKNELYTVVVNDCRNGFDLPMVHLSIKRNDKEPIHDWRHLQQIKNELVGAECEALELYPAESRLVDSANQFHLWAFTEPGVRVPLGYNERFTGSAEEAERGGAKQRAFEEPC